MDIELVTDRDACVYDVYRVTTCRPGRGHIVAAARLQLVVPRFTRATFAKARAMSNNRGGCLGCLNGRYSTGDVI